MRPEAPATDLKWGAAILLAVAALFALGLWFGPRLSPHADKPAQADVRLVETVLDDAASRAYLNLLDKHAPVAAQDFRVKAARAIGDGWTRAEMREALLQTAFAQFQGLAFDVKKAPVASFDQIIAAFSDGMRRLDAAGSTWCAGPRVAAFLKQDDDALMPALIDQFASDESYDWALGFAGLFLEAAGAARKSPQNHEAPGWTDEYYLQQAGVEYGTQKWLLALQIGAFSNAEGQSYALMQEAIEKMQVCQLGMAVGEVSLRLEPDVRGRIWADLIPEMMYANTPYVLWRVNDYFFIG